MSRMRRERQAERRDPSRKGRPWWRTLELVLWLGVAALFVWRFAPQAGAALGWPSRGVAAPAVTLRLLDGGTLDLAALEGNVVLLNFWATWCPPCRAEMPAFQELYDERRAAGFTVVGVAMDDGPRERVDTFLGERAISYPVGFATPAALAAFGGVASLPTSVLIDRRGRIRYTVRGYFAETTLRAAVNRLLAEGGGEGT